MMGEAGAPELILAELELWHTRPLAPTRRLSLGNLVLPVEPPPGLGGLLLAAVVANFRGQLDAELLPDVHRLIEQVGRGERVVQPRLRHRFQVDRHGLARSQHRLLGAPLVDGGTAEFSFAAGGAPLAMVLGAVYALERLNEVARAAIARCCTRRSTGPGRSEPRLLAEPPAPGRCRSPRSPIRGRGRSTCSASRPARWHRPSRRSSRSTVVPCAVPTPTTAATQRSPPPCATSPRPAGAESLRWWAADGVDAAAVPRCRGEPRCAGARRGRSAGGHDDTLERGPCRLSVPQGRQTTPTGHRCCCRRCATSWRRSVGVATW